MQFAALLVFDVFDAKDWGELLHDWRKIKSPDRKPGRTKALFKQSVEKPVDDKVVVKRLAVLREDLYSVFTLAQSIILQKLLHLLAMLIDKLRRNIDFAVEPS